jgi:hypothetical protein
LRFTQVSIVSMGKLELAPVARVSVVLYVRTTHWSSAEAFLREVRRYAECRYWDVAAALADTHMPGVLGDRPNWRDARELVAVHRAAGIVTRYRSMAVPEYEYPQLERWLAEQGAFLTCTRQGDLASAS